MTLDDQQLAILRHLVAGHDRDVIARLAHCSPRTVRRRLLELYQLTGCRSSTHLAVWAAVNRLVPVDVPRCDGAPQVRAVAAGIHITHPRPRKRATA